MKPDYLQQGDTIGITAPARCIFEEEVMPTVQLLKEQGFNVLLSPHLFDKDNQYAGTDAERAADMQALLDNPEVKAILCARGGYGSVRIIDQLDFSHFAKYPKWLCGYSDVTVFHSHLATHYHIPSLHCTMPVNIKTALPLSESVVAMLRALRGETLHYVTPPHPLNRKGKGKGKILGGNLSILYSLLGSPSDINTEGTILFIEDLDEYLYHIDRMMMNLKRNGKLEKLAGILIGGMTDMHDNTIPYGKSAEEIVAEHCQEYHFPVCFNFPAGHTTTNLALRLGVEAELSVETGGELTINA